MCKKIEPISNPLISVIVNAYNVEQYIRRCLNSVLHQTYRNLEIIVVDDCSSDQTSHIIDSIAEIDSRIHVLHHSMNTGLSGGRNTGLENCHGKYITFVDADDWLEPDYVEYLYSLIAKFDADVAISRNFFTSRFRTQITNDAFSCITSDDMLCDIFYNRIHVGVWNRLYRKTLISGKKFRLESKTGEGMQFNTQVLPEANRIAVGLRRVYTYNVDNSMSATKKPNIEKQAIGAVENMDYIKTHLVPRSKAVDNALEYQYLTTSIYAIEHLIRAEGIKSHKSFYRNISRSCRKLAVQSFAWNLSKKQLLKSAAILISPYLTAYSAVVWRYKFGKKQRV
ncbi:MULTISPECIES: glycosyltransferase family 2 protein [Bifidobacterium]|uniref:glycosyltransferase family 2 protein n=1 Tax=Bifidobacterium TaxID=1678 RepID=UPI001BDD392C|nr:MULTISPECIES: glycosyltransferase family 2 protein [Bifidobacterium]MBT1162619.1 glycosyltransferase family 2 protein [Bifidobacterium sp. SO1]MBW3079766.1 glycosyltransferase family 2 protein [Bifidobacterium simiiventris]